MQGCAETMHVGAWTWRRVGEGWGAQDLVGTRSVQAECRRRRRRVAMSVCLSYVASMWQPGHGDAYRPYVQEKWTDPHTRGRKREGESMAGDALDAPRRHVSARMDSLDGHGCCGWQRKCGRRPWRYRLSQSAWACSRSGTCAQPTQAVKGAMELENSSIVHLLSCTPCIYYVHAPSTIHGQDACRGFPRTYGLACPGLYMCSGTVQCRNDST